MSTPKVEVIIGATTQTFHKAMSGVEKRLHGLKEFTHFGLKEQLIGLVGAGSIGLLVDNMLNWADATEKASKNMGIAIEQVEQFQAIARHAGVDLDFFAGTFNKLNESAEEALGTSKGGAKKKGLFDKLHVNDEDLKHLQGPALQQKVLRGTTGLSDADARSTLNALFGKKAGGTLLGSRDEILNPEKYGSKVSAEDVQALAELKMEMENLADIVRSRVIPILSAFGKAIESIILRVSGAGKVAGAGYSAMEANAENKPSIWRKIAGAGLFVAGHLNRDIARLTGNISKEQYQADNKTIGDNVHRYLYGEKGFQAGMATAKVESEKVNKADDEYEQRKAARLAAFNKKQEELKNGDAGRTGISHDGPMKELLSSSQKGGDNPFLKIGGLAGIDPNYEIQRLAKESNSFLAQIVRNTAPRDFGPDNDDPFKE